MPMAFKAYCSNPSMLCSWILQKIRIGAWKRVSDLSRCCTPGSRLLWIIFICTASSSLGLGTCVNWGYFWHRPTFLLELGTLRLRDAIHKLFTWKDKKSQHWIDELGRFEYFISFFSHCLYRIRFFRVRFAKSATTSLYIILRPPVSDNDINRHVRIDFHGI